jgi:uncharacterized protein (DUF427 family)
MTIRATCKGPVIAESDDTVVIEGNHSFPPDAVNDAYLEPSDTHTTWPWKGLASYRSVVVDGARVADAAWCYPDRRTPRKRPRTASPSGRASSSPEDHRSHKARRTEVS